MTRTLIKGGCVLSMSQATGNHLEADVLIEGDTITEIGPSLRARDATVVEAGDAIVMPGFVDTHRHVSESLFRGLGDVFRVHRLSGRYCPPLLGRRPVRSNPDRLARGGRSGDHHRLDWCEVNTEDAHTDAALQAHADSGLRTVFAYGRADSGGGRWRRGLRRLAGNPRPPSTHRLAAGLAERNGDSDDWTLARELGLRIHTHAGTSDPGHVRVGRAEPARGGCHPGARLPSWRRRSRRHRLDKDGDGAHALQRTGAAVLRRLSIQRLIDRGIRPGLGIDTERIAPGDLFAQIRATISLQHATYFDSKLAGKAGLPKLLTTREVIRYATIDGARAVGLGDVTGSLEVGKQADIVVLRTDRPNIFPINDPIGAVVWGMDTSNVDWVFVAGNPVVREGAIDADLDRVRKLAATARQQVAGASGLLVGAR